MPNSRYSGYQYETYNKVKILLVDIFNKDHDLDFVFECNLGFVNYMNLFKDVIPGYYNKFEDVNGLIKR